MPDSDNIIEQVAQLVSALKDLMAHSSNGWVTWPEAAKQIYGTPTYAPILSGIAALQEWRHLFFVGNSRVKLSPAGLQFQSPIPVCSASEMQKIAEAVRSYASRLRDIFLRVEAVKPVAKVANKHVEAIYVGLTDEVIASETPVTLIPNGTIQVSGKIVGQEPDGGVLYIAFDHAVDDSHLPARLKVDRGYLIYQLSERIRSLPALPERIKPVLEGTEITSVMIADDDSVKVADGLAKLPPPWTRLLWGPPGAGKTFGLGHLVKQLLLAGDEGRILLVAPSNRAVDVAVEQLVGQLEQGGLGKLIEQRKILRYGYPRKTQILERPELLGPVDLDRLNREVKNISAEIGKAEQEKNVDDVALAILRTSLLAAQEEVKNAVYAHVKESSVVATTTTSAYLEASPISQFPWDTILIDEVTMVCPAMCAYLASLATDRLLLAGDPRQLGPVYESGNGGGDDFEWMGRDIFDRSGISVGKGMQRQIKTTDSRLARITSQRRCARAIWAGVQDLYPEVAHRTNDDRLADLLALPPKPGQAMVLLDTSTSVGHNNCAKVGRSWHNPFTAELALEIALTLAAEASRKITVAIITPYRAQVRLLRKWIRQEQKAVNSPYEELAIEAGTVHQFQGSDADVVIFDLVDGPGRSGLGNLLRGDAGIRLVNVAVTRARGKFILLADRRWCKQHVQAEENPLLLRLVSEELARNSVQVLPPKRPSKTADPRQVLTESPIERILLEQMLGQPEFSGVVPQYVIKDQEGTPVTRADFAFPELKYAIYCDGKQWHLKEDRWQRDLRQRNKLTELGWIFSVFTGRDIHKKAALCVEQIISTYRSRNILLNQGRDRRLE